MLFTNNYFQIKFETVSDMEVGGRGRKSCHLEDNQKELKIYATCPLTNKINTSPIFYIFNYKGDIKGGKFTN